MNPVASILIVDDDEEITDLLTPYLASFGFVTHCAADGEVMRTQLSRHSIDLLVSRLRQKLAEDAGEPSMIKTVRGAGYMFNVRKVHGRMAWPA